MPSCSAILSYHSCCNDLILPGPFGPAVYYFPNDLIRPWAFLPMGSCVPFFPWASLAYLFVLGFLGSFTNFVFLWTFTDFIGLFRPNFILILWVHGLAINPLLSLLALLWACHSPFLLFSHHTLLMSLLLTISLFPGSFEPICFLKAHLLILWTCNPLFLLFELNGFFILCLLPTSLCC